MTAKTILAESLRRQMRLTPEGDGLLYEYVAPPDADFIEILRDNKPALMLHLTWLRYLAKQTVLGEFDGASLAMLQKVTGELQENRFDLVCRRALGRLQHQSPVTGNEPP